MFQAPALTTVDSGDYTPLDGTSGAFHLTSALVGAGTSGPAIPPEVAQVITLRTALRGRRARGRIFLPAFASGAYTGGTLDPARQTTVLSAAATLMSDLVSLGWQLVVASYGVSYRVNHTTTPATKVASTWTPFATAVTSITMDALADVIRGRKR
jgi:hypothetical protein